MNWTVDFIARLITDARIAYARKWTFLGVFAFIFIGCVYVLGRLDLLPERGLLSGTQTAAVMVSNNQKRTQVASAGEAGTASIVAQTVVEKPVKVSIPSLNLSVSVSNPVTTNVEALDALLLKGSVRYPTSALLGENGNVVLFGHSSYLPVVGNQSYKAFNGIQKLKMGDTITVYSSGTAYTYAVRTVKKESATDAVIPLGVSGRVLTLATCDSFGKKTDRFVVTADFVESHLIGA